MPLTNDELTYVRSWVGNTETDAVLNERYDRLALDQAEGDRTAVINQVIVESLRSQLAAMMLDAPGSMTIDDISLSYNTNIQYLRDVVKTFEEEVIGGTALGSEGRILKRVRPPVR